MDWQLLIGQLGGTTVGIAAIAWLARAILSQGLSRQMESHKAELRHAVDTAVEHLRLHSVGYVDAHKRLFVFAKSLANCTFPLAEKKCHSFKSVMNDQYFDKLQMDQVYFSDAVSKTLDEFESMYVCMTEPDLIPETEDETHRFLEKEVFPKSEVLAKAARLSIRSVRDAVQLVDAD